VKFIVLASGSKGNCTYLEIGQKKFLIDVGISLKQIVFRLSIRNKELSTLDGVFITHEHIDHVMGLIMVAKTYKMPIYLSEGTYKNLNFRILDKIDSSYFRFIDFESPILLDECSILPFMTYHDALEPCGYRFTESGTSLVYLTDTGYFPQKNFDILRNATAYIIEANHSLDLLLDSNRPWTLKRRILDDQGHLSNDDSAFLTINLVGENTKLIILAHLSEECNTEEDALAAYTNVFLEQGLIIEDFEITCARQNEPLEEMCL